MHDMVQEVILDQLKDDKDKYKNYWTQAVKVISNLNKNTARNFEIELKLPSHHLKITSDSKYIWEELEDEDKRLLTNYRKGVS